MKEQTMYLEKRSKIERDWKMANLNYKFAIDPNEDDKKTYLSSEAKLKLEQYESLRHKIYSFDNDEVGINGDILNCQCKVRKYKNIISLMEKKKKKNLFIKVKIKLLEKYSNLDLANRIWLYL